MKTSDIKNAVIEKLQQDIDEVEIGTFPNDPKNYVLGHPIGAVLIAYDGTNYTEPKIVQQLFIYSITATLLFHSNVDSDKMLEIADEVRQSITNELYPFGSRFYCVSLVPLGEEDNVWYYKMKFVLPGVITQGD